jgi:hypothetical protein
MAQLSIRLLELLGLVFHRHNASKTADAAWFFTMQASPPQEQSQYIKGCLLDVSDNSSAPYHIASTFSSLEVAHVLEREIDS